MMFWEGIVELDKKLDTISYYELLGVSDGCDTSEIRSQYYRFAASLHPDRFVTRGDQVKRAALNRVYARLGEARTILQHPKQRTLYDSGLKNGQFRFKDTSKKPRQFAARDPSSQMAYGLYEKALVELDHGFHVRARANLQLAEQYEPDSPAIRIALGRCPKVTRASSTSVLSKENSDIVHSEAAVTVNQGDVAPPYENEMRLRAVKGTQVRRKEPLVKRHVVRLRISSWEQLETLYTRDICRGRMFLRMKCALHVDSPLQLDLFAPSGTCIRLDAVVEQVRRKGEVVVGVGLRFVNISPQIKAEIEIWLANASSE